MVNPLNAISARAVMPEQLIPYTQAISGLESRSCGSCVVHLGGGQAVLAAYPLHDPLDIKAMNEAARIALNLPGLENLVVIGPQAPDCAPPDAAVKKDHYWSLDLANPAPGAKTRNMLKRAAREVDIVQSRDWTGAHAALVDEFARRKKLDAGSLYLFGNLAAYLAGAPQAALFSAKNREGNVVACAIADFTALATAFYMFAFRSTQAPPGAADLLLAGIIDEAGKRGHSRLNLGLGMDAGVEFFKKKWGATPWLPYVETEWRVKKRGWLKKLFGRGE